MKCPHSEAFNCANTNCCPGKKNTCFSNLTSATWHGPIHEWRFKAGCLDRQVHSAETPCAEEAKPLASYSDEQLASEMQRRSDLDAGKSTLLEMTLTAAGDVDDYGSATQLQMAAAVATAAGIQSADVLVNVASGSVLLTAQLAIKGGSAGLATAQAKLAKVFSSVDACSGDAARTFVCPRPLTSLL